MDHKELYAQVMAVLLDGGAAINSLGAMDVYIRPFSI